jgi:transposase InsO family protein
MGGKHLTIACKISKNGYGVTSHALIDSGANGFVFIDTLCAMDIAEYLGLKAQPLPRTITVKGYDGQSCNSASHYLRLHLTIDGRRQYNVPFVILDLGSHDIILGRKWLAQFDIGVDCRRNCLLWPRELGPSCSIVKEIVTTRRGLLPQRTQWSHQEDANARDRAIEEEDRVLGISSTRDSELQDLQEEASSGSEKSSGSGGGSTDITNYKSDGPVPITPERPRLVFDPAAREEKKRAIARTTYAFDSWNSLQKMDNNLQGIEKCKHVPYRKKPFQPLPEPYKVDIASIHAVGLHLNMKRPENEIFGTSLYEIDRILGDRCDTIADVPQIPQAYVQFGDMFSKEASDTLPPHRSYDHQIHLDKPNTLSFSPLYKMTTEELEEVKRYLTDNLHKGFIEPSQSPFAAPVLFVKKPNGSLRFCIDFRKLNELTRKDRYPLPLIDEMLARISKAKVFTKLDIRQAFHRIRIHPDSEELTTFRTRYGSYKCKVLPFGLTNGPATYQRYMNDVLFDYLDNFCTAYLDDILIYSENELEHEEHVKKVLKRLRDAGLQVDLKKCEFSVTRTKYLGFVITTDGIEVDLDKVAAVVDWKIPHTVRGIQSFLGFCNFYRRFIKDYGKVAKPLVHLTKTDVPFVFGKDCWDAFEELKSKLTSAPVLRHYSPDYDSMIETDASDGVIAGILSQLHPDGEWYPVAYYSKIMAPAECNYGIHDKEMLAVVKSLKEWRPELHGAANRIKIYTDHKALEYFMTTKQLTSRQARWAEALSEYYFMIMHRAGKQNGKADALTRRDDEVTAQNGIKAEYRTKAFLSQDQVDPRVLKDLGIEVPEVDMLAPVKEDTFDEPIGLVDRILQANRGSASLDALRVEATSNEPNEFELEDGILLYSGRLVVPQVDKLPTALIKEAHDQVSTAHPGRDKTYQLLRPRYYWPRMKADIDRFIRNCHPCRKSHVPRDKTPGYLHTLPIPEHPWQHITMDFKSMPKDRHGYDSIFVVIDRLSKEAISVPCHKTTTAEDMARMFITHVYRYYGPPVSSVSDRGPQFISQFWKEFCRILGIKLKLSTAYHPQTDGQTEIMNQYLDQRLRPFVNYYQDNWSELLPMMDYAQLTLPHSSIGMSPFELLYGRLPRTSFDWNTPKASSPQEQLSQSKAQEVAKRMQGALELAKENMAKAQAKKERDINVHRRPVDFEPGDQVYISTKNWKTDRPSRKLGNQMDGPFPIIRQVGNSFEVKLPDSMKIHNVFSPDRLRKEPGDPLPGQLNEPLGPEVVHSEEEYEVQEVLASRTIKNQLEYRIKWVGYDEDPEWYAASNVKNAPHKLRDYHLANPTRAGPPRRLLEWLKAWEDDTDDDIEDNRPMPQSLRASFFQKGG